MATRDEITYGLIFLFKWRQEVDNRTSLDCNNVPELFFAKQTVQNACATQAILSVLLNADQHFQLPPFLKDLKEFAMVIDAENKGYAIGNCDQLRLAHNSFARPEPIVQEEIKRPVKYGDDVYHFIAYVPHQSHVYE